MLLRRSKEAADQDTKERGIEFNDYLEAVDHEVYTEEAEVNVDIDFAMLRRTESNPLPAALAFPGIATDSLSLLWFSRNPQLLGACFTPAALVKTWSKELKAFKDKEWSDPDDADADANVSSQFDTGGLEAALVPVLGYSAGSIASLQFLQASFQAQPSVENLLALIATQYPLNQKQRMIVRALNLRILLPIQISSVRDQFLFYLSGIG